MLSSISEPTMSGGVIVRPKVREAYRQVLRHIRAEGLGPGSRLPAQEDLVERLGLCSATISRAMRVFSEEGVVTRKRGVGTVICEPERALQTVWAVALACEEHAGGGFHSALKERVRNGLVHGGCVDRTFLPPLGRAASSLLCRSMDGFVGLRAAVSRREVDAIVTLFLEAVQDSPVPALAVGAVGPRESGVFVDVGGFVMNAFQELRRRGSRCVALITWGDEQSNPTACRAYSAAMERHGRGDGEGGVLYGFQDLDGGRAAAETLLQRPPEDRPDGLVLTEDYPAAGTCERLRAAGDYRPRIAVMTNKQLPLSYSLPVLHFENDLDLLAAEVVKMVKDRLLDPEMGDVVKMITPALEDESGG